MATFANKRKAPEKPVWVHDHRRVINGEPFTTHGWTDAQKARHLGVVIPEPVHEREFFPEPQDVFPAGMFERRSVQVDGQWEAYWFDVRYAERANMPEFKRKPDAEADARDSRDIRARVSPNAAQRKDLA